MGKKLLILAVISFACFGLAYAAVENIKVSGDITAHAITRDFSLGSKAIADAESFLLSQVRLRLDADLTENVSAVVRLINERLWDSETAANSDIDLDLGYVEMKEFLYQPLTIVIGRQPLRYGNGLIIGDPDTNQDVATALTGVADDLSLRKSFDAIKAILDFSPWVLDLVYAKINEGGTNVNDDVNLFGGNLAYSWNSFGGITEVYFWVFDNNRLASYGLATTQHPEAQTTTYVVGGRMQFNPIERLTLGLEGAYQFGDVNVDVLSDGTTGASEYQHLSAFAAQAMAEYRFATNYNPVLGLIYAYFSGDDDTTDDNHNAWDPVAENQTAGEIINILFPNSNAHVIKLYGSMMPREDITLGLAYIWTKMAQHYVNLPTYSPWAGPASGNTYQV
ncbi:MAG: alginate export family protein, partial [Candidatus Omnitrophica bacterium]|nr:alginate export family protein [Candidatus Omnitrophota bacterium]